MFLTKLFATIYNNLSYYEILAVKNKCVYYHMNQSDKLEQQTKVFPS